VSYDTTQDGGFSLAQGLTLSFDSTNWWKPQRIWFAVDNNAESIPTSGDIQNTIQVSCVLSGPVPPPPAPPPACASPVPHPTIDGTVQSSVSVDGNVNTVGDEYAVLTATTAIFDTPSSSLPEGLRGESLKITGGDSEAAGQIRLVLAAMWRRSPCTTAIPSASALRRPSSLPRTWLRFRPPSTRFSAERAWAA